MNENPHTYDRLPIPFSELFEVSIIGTAQDWEDFSYKYPHVFAPGPFTVSPTNQEGEIFTHFQFLSIEYWNIYCYTNIRGEENAIRSDLLLETYNNIALNKKNDKSTIRSLIINENKIKNKIKNEIKDEGDFVNMEYGKQMFIDEYALDKFSHFTEYIFCSTLYSFFEDILTKFVFELSGNKCFKDNIRSKNQMHGNEKYMSSIKINLKQPNESKYKNRDDYLQALSRYNVTINRHLPDPFNVEYHKFYKKNKKTGDREIPDYIVKAKYIDMRCNTNLYNDLLKESKFKDFKKQRNNIMHAKTKEPSIISTLECFDLILETLNYLFENEEIQRQLYICIDQNCFYMESDNPLKFKRNRNITY